ncbi:hypothetical protein NP233_g3556 [Leucocoprinus birnbaumii]|uniref:Peptide hydrolase n=1 Tax=Leucocoprinus birnbaumii TaxID=56174 RepID=A0AAD5VYW9_9AGAR|nr:hypothetical protein NP233_g3556 [Leucocoprinus birnbaumii]
MNLRTPSFSSGSVSSAVLVSYIVILFLVFWENVLPDAPKDQQGLSLESAYNDLHHITERPHPYNSHANDYVRQYILERVYSIADEYPHVHVVDDLRSNGSWASSSYGVYFEGTNVLVKVDGTNPDFWDKSGVLFSAHYDSVSTAPGTTDDGMGVVTLLQLIEYFSKHRTERTAIFNINNGEEDWLNGAHAFLQHPWSQIPDSFLNLEGAASGGRPILFRATSSAVLRAFKSRNVPRPHANVLSADAFKRGAIRSGTDYEVYTDGANMQGLDLAFYKGRSKYHTKFDAIPYTDGQERSLWAMMEAARGAGASLLSESATHDPDNYVPAVYFDLFSVRLVLFPLNSLYIFNIIFLILGPILLIALLFIQAVIKAAQKGHSEEHYRLIWRWSKFWVAIIVTLAVQALLVLISVKANPYIVYSSPYIVLFCLTSVSFVTFTWIIAYDLPAAPHDDVVESSAENQKEIIILQSYFLSWILLLLSTIAIGKSEIGGLYLVTFWSLGLWLASSVRSLDTIFSVRHLPTAFVPIEHRSRSGSPSSYGPRIHHEEPTEQTPLVQGQDNGHGGYTENDSGSREHDESHKREDEKLIDWWSLQFIFTVPAPVILAAHIGNLLLDATCQTLADGNSKATVYASASLIGFLLVLPLAPFSFHIHRSIGSILLIFVVVFGIWSLVVFPFNPDAPLKIYFQQQVQLEGAVTTSPLSTQLSAVNAARVPVIRNITTSFYGVHEFLESDIIPTLPSAHGKNITCIPSTTKPGLIGCTWSGGVAFPDPGAASTPHNETTPVGPGANFFNAQFLRTSTTTARITIHGTNTKNCRLYFDKQPIIKYVVQGSSNGMQYPYRIHEPGLKELRLWSREYNKDFTVDIEWRDNYGLGEGIKGRVACEWAEFASASAGLPSEGEDPVNGGFRSAKIPMLEEVLAFLPTWVAVSKFTDGLVEAWEYFEV